MSNNILILIAIGVAVLALLAWLLLRGGDAPTPTQRPQQPRAPLQPNKPEIELAKPVSFAAPAPEPVPVPVAATTAATAIAPAIAPAVGAPDDLKRIKGVGPKLATLLASLGVTRFDQIAAWGEAEIAAVDVQLGQFAGRIARDSWVEQAGYLAKGDEAGFTARFGAL